MAVGVQQLRQESFIGPAAGLWRAVSFIATQWKERRRRRRLTGSRLSDAWLRQHEIDAAKHPHAF